MQTKKKEVKKNERKTWEKKSIGRGKKQIRKPSSHEISEPNENATWDDFVGCPFAETMRGYRNQHVRRYTSRSFVCLRKICNVNTKHVTLHIACICMCHPHA